ncbi:hypothetical protein GJ496_009317 [Pomphorhynchus laevis]|nr:hypothetical protein GJ496_009317 [Pomphorhynchus laevis]
MKIKLMCTAYIKTNCKNTTKKYDIPRLLRAKFWFAMARAVSLGIRESRIPCRRMARSQLNSMNYEQQQGVSQLEPTLSKYSD